MIWRYKRNFEGSILFVDFATEKNDFLPTLEDIGRATLFARNLDEANVILSLGVVGAVVTVIDPLEPDNIEKTNALVTRTEELGLPIASMSLFNPDWIENLASQLGFETHFRGIPDAKQIAELATTSEPALGVNRD
ncbi:MAG: hypothetical protein AAF340_02830 [Pseudomonadota bacterium]